MHKIFSYQQSVHAEHIDYNNHVNNLVYLRWAHQASDKHWLYATTAQMQAKHAWVLGRQEIDYLRELKLDDEIMIDTFIEKIERQKCYRVVEF
jgi:acyl-CoA thioester hydrolase